MAVPDFEFVVEELFRITGRGVDVLREWRCGQFTSVTADTFSWVLR